MPPSRRLPPVGPFDQRDHARQRRLAAARFADHGQRAAGLERNDTPPTACSRAGVAEQAALDGVDLRGQAACASTTASAPGCDSSPGLVSGLSAAWSRRAPPGAAHRPAGSGSARRRPASRASAGRTPQARSVASAQRGANRQPRGRSYRPGTTPGMLASRACRRLRSGMRRQQRRRVGMLGRVEECLRVALLDHLAGVHHRTRVAPSRPPRPCCA